MIVNAGKSIEAQDMHRKDFEAQVKAYQAETQRIAAVQNSLGEEQIHDIVMGTLHAAMATGDIVSAGQNLGTRDNIPENEPQELSYEPMQSNPSAGA